MICNSIYCPHYYTVRCFFLRVYCILRYIVVQRSCVSSFWVHIFEKVCICHSGCRRRRWRRNLEMGLGCSVCGLQTTWENRFPSNDPSPTVNPVTMGKVNHLSILICIIRDPFLILKTFPKSTWVLKTQCFLSWTPKVRCRARQSCGCQCPIGSGAIEGGMGWIFLLGLAGGRDDGLLRLGRFFSKFVWFLYTTKVVFSDFLKVSRLKNQSREEVLSRMVFFWLG